MALLSPSSNRSPKTAYIDAHCHLADKRLDGIRNEALARARSAGIGLFIQGGVDPRDWQRQLELGDADWLLSFGLHPWWVVKHDRNSCIQALDELDTLLPKAFALGELGLDFFHRFPKESHERQREMFRRQLELAKKHHKPLILHLVHCHGEAPEIIRSAGHFKGLVHGFTGSYEVARQYLDSGLLISVGPAVTRPGYKKLKNAVARLPVDGFVIESDAPDGAPEGFPFQQNDPSSMALTAKAVADIRETTPDNVLENARANLVSYFDLPVT